MLARTLFRISALFLFLHLEASAQQYSVDNPTRVRRRSPIESDVFLANWWDYYNRAIRRVDQRDFEGAKSDLLEAIEFRPEDSPNARTFGVRFQEYFPHCELGLIYFGEGRYREAIEEFRISLRTAPLEESRFFLHESYRALALAGELDTANPTLAILEPIQEMETGESSVRIEGIAYDDLYVDRIEVGGKRILVDPLQAEVPFEMEVSLEGGENEIPVVVTDLAERSHSFVFSIYADHFGPAIALKKIELTADKAKARLEIEVYDSSGISAIRLNGGPLPLGQDQDRIVVDREVLINGPDGTVRVEAFDGFGNDTISVLDPRMKTSAAPGIRNRVRVASLGLKPEYFQSATVRPPKISLEGFQQGQRIYQDKVVVDIVATDRNGVSALFCNGDYQDLPEGKHIELSYHWSNLKEGTNTLVIEAENVDEVTSTESLRVQCDLLKVDLEDKLRVVVLPVERASQGSRVPMDLYGIYEGFIFHLGQRDRFRWIQQADPEFLEQALREKKIALSSLADPSQRPEFASFEIPDYLIRFDETVYQNDRSRCVLEVIPLDSINTVNLFGSLGTSEPFAEILVRPILENRVESIDRVGEELALRLEREFPKVEGRIVEAQGLRISGDLSGEDGVKPGMEVAVFREADPDNFGKNRKLDRGKPEQLGRLKISNVYDDRCLLRPLPNQVGEVHERDVIITR